MGAHSLHDSWPLYRAWKDTAVGSSWGKVPLLGGGAHDGGQVWRTAAPRASSYSRGGILAIRRPGGPLQGDMGERNISEKIHRGEQIKRQGLKEMITKKISWGGFRETH